MASKTFIFCPGQGAQVVGMGKDYYSTSPAARETIDLANQIMGFDLASICFGGPEERLNQTDVSQPAIYVTGVACFRAAEAVGRLRLSDVTTCAGLSLGEYTALHLAGVFSFEDGLRLVAARGRFMQEAAVATPSGMVAIVGADERAVDTLCLENAQGEVLVAANYNAPGQIVVSGAKSACARVVQSATSAGFKAIELKVAGAFHSPLMQSGADKMRAELEKFEFKQPVVTVFSNVTARPHTDVASIKRLLVDQIVMPVRWEQTMKTLVTGNEGERFVELAPGHTLTGLAKKINRRLPIESLEAAEALNA